MPEPMITADYPYGWHWRVQLPEQTGRRIREALERTAAERRRRRMVALIDLALDECERLNLAVGDDRGLPVPVWVEGLIEELAADDGQPLARPTKSVAAHGALLHLQACHLAGALISRGEEAAWLVGNKVWLAGKQEGRW